MGQLRSRALVRTIGDVGVFLVDKYAGVFVHRNKYDDVSPKEFALAILCAHTVPPQRQHAGYSGTKWTLNGAGFVSSIYFFFFASYIFVNIFFGSL